MKEEKLFLWQCPALTIGSSIERFLIVREFISKTFSIFNMLETEMIKIEGEVVDEHDDQTSYLFTITGTGIDAGTCAVSLTVEDDEVLYVSGDGDTNSVTPEQLRDIILVNMIYGYQE